MADKVIAEKESLVALSGPTCEKRQWTRAQRARRRRKACAWRAGYLSGLVCSSGSPPPPPPPGLTLQQPGNLYEQLREELVEFNAPQEELVEFNAPQEKLVEFNAPQEELVDFKASQEVEFNAPQEEFEEFKEPQEELVEFNEPQEEFNAQQEEIVEFNAPQEQLVESNAPQETPLRWKKAGPHAHVVIYRRHCSLRDMCLSSEVSRDAAPEKDSSSWDVGEFFEDWFQVNDSLAMEHLAKMPTTNEEMEETKTFLRSSLFRDNFEVHPDGNICLRSAA